VRGRQTDAQAEEAAAACLIAAHESIHDG